MSRQLPLSQIQFVRSTGNRLSLTYHSRTSLFAGAVLFGLTLAAAGDEPEPRLDSRDSAPLVHYVQPAEPAMQPAAEEAPPPEAPALAELEALLEQPVLVPLVTSASRREEKVTEAPATVIVISRRDIELRGYSQLTDVLRDLPGLETIEYYFSEFGTQVPVRGISGNNKIVVLVNGMRVNPPGGENFPFRSDFSVRHAERIEVVYGSGSTLYGQDAISAVINVVTQTPTEGCADVEIGAEGGVNGEREIWGWYGGVLNCCHDLKVSTYVQYHDSDLTPLDREFRSYWQDYRDVAITKTNGQGVEPARNDYGLNVFARVEGFNSSFQVWHRQSERSSSEGFNPILGFVPEAKWGDSSTVLEGKNTLSLCDEVALESRGFCNGYEIDPASRYVFPASATEWYLDDFKYGVGWSLGVEEILRVELTEDFSLLAGGLVSYSDVIPKATFTGSFDSSMDPVAQGGFFTYTDASGMHTIPQVAEVKYWTYAAYLEAQWQVLERLRLIGGARVTKDDHFDEIPVTPRAAVVYNLTDRMTAKYIYTQAFVAPAPYFAFATYDNGTLLATTNPSVAPETADTHEVNLTYIRENVSLGLSGYYGKQGNIIIVSDRAAPQNILESPVFLNGDPTQPRTLVQTANGGESERYGADLYGKMTFGSLSPWLSYSYVDFRETNAGMSSGLPGISKHNGRLGATWEITPKLFLTPSLVIRSTPENVRPGRLADEINDPWEVNLYLLYRRSECLDLFVDLRNITDHHYALGGFTGEAIPQETFHGVAGVRLMY
jgi:outer membrane receptor protein involved in Fe transport